MQYTAQLSRHVSPWMTSCAGLLLLLACGGDDDAGTTASFAGAGGQPAGGAAAVGGAGGAAGAAGSGEKRGLVGIAGAGEPGGGGVPGDTCAMARVGTTPITPTIWLVVDGSTSMRNRFVRGQDRWDALRSSLMDPGGIVDSLQAVAKFGMVIYAGQENSDLAMCVQLVTVQPALNNHAALAAMYPDRPLADGTPTDKALDYVVTSLPVTNEAVLDGKASPTYVVLATDGQPNEGCGNLSAGSYPVVKQRVVDVTLRGADSGMRMYVISMAGSDDELQAHLEQVAMATVSRTAPFVPATRNELIETFQAIVGGASCQIELEGSVKEGQACTGEVTLNGKELACGSDNGWRLIDDDTFQLTGDACDTFLSSDSNLTAMFPCEVLVPQ